MKATYCLEIGCEEIPSRFLDELCVHLESKFEEALAENRLVCDKDNIKTYATYRRLVVMVPELEDKQLDESVYIKGPPVKIGLDNEGGFSQASLGFAKKFSISQSELLVREFNGAEHVCYLKETKGLTTKDVLATIVPKIITSLPLAIAMRWGSRSETFIRPIHWIVSLYHDQLVPFTLFNVEAGTISYAHRMLSQGKDSLGQAVSIKSADLLTKQLKDHSVMVDPKKREEVIVTALNEHNQQNYDNGLLQEVVYLTEWPCVLQGHFQSHYLELPDFVLIECMRKHQRYFPVVIQGKGLKESFLVVADNKTEQNRDTIIRGNERVLAARLEDALFFYNQDCLLGLEAFPEKLKGVVFQKNCGTMYDKQERLAKLLTFLNQHIKPQGGLKESYDFNRLAYLSKADLVSHMVTEFPSLQGKMGAHYAAKDSATSIYAPAIGEQYLLVPDWSDDKSAEGALLALADRFDTMVYSIFNGAKPTGSQDPLGLRRSINIIFCILNVFKWSCDIFEVCRYCFELIGANAHEDRLHAFITARFQALLTDEGLGPYEKNSLGIYVGGYSYDIAESIVPLALKNVSLAIQKAVAIETFKRSNFDGFKLLSETAVRVHRLVSKHDSLQENNTFSAINTDLFEQDIEKHVYDDIAKSKEWFLNGQHLDCEKLVEISKQFTSYFDNVLVMADDEKLRNNRLQFLAYCDTVFKQLANFEKVVITQ
tara:strand:+ start:5165 stop:7297 length:2133 start_codon:yes stop_codon:yes gene_type:complete